MKTTAEPLPDSRGHYGRYGGRFVPETLIPALTELEHCYSEATRDSAFQAELMGHLKDFVGRETPLYEAKNLTKHLNGPSIYLKREDLCHTGSHKLNNALGQILLAKRMGKKRIIAETGAGQHGVASATVAAAFGLSCVVYMGREDMERQALNVFRMRLLGARVVPVDSGSRTLKDACNEAIRDWVTNIRDTYYIIGSVVGPHPYPMIVRDFQSVIGHEAREQILAKTGKLPAAVIACVGGGSNSMGLFQGFINDENVHLIGVEAAGLGLDTSKHAASLTKGTEGVLHGSLNSVIQTPDGQIIEAYSISAGLDYPGVGPEHAYLRDTKRAEYITASDAKALQAFQLLCRTEGIIPALESSHAIAGAIKVSHRFSAQDSIVICLSGRGDKDVEQVSMIMEGKDR